MLKVKLVVPSFSQLWDAYEWFKKKTVFFEVIKVQDNLTTGLRNITLVFDFDQKMMGELEIRCEPVHPLYETNLFFEELAHSPSNLEFTQTLLRIA